MATPSWQINLGGSYYDPGSEQWKEETRIADWAKPYVHADGSYKSYKQLQSEGLWDLSNPNLLRYFDALSNTGSKAMRASGSAGDWRTSPDAQTTLFGRLGLSTADALRQPALGFGDPREAFGDLFNYDSAEAARAGQVKRAEDSSGFLDTAGGFIEGWGKNFVLPAAATYFGVNALGGALGGAAAPASAGGTAAAEGAGYFGGLAPGAGGVTGLTPGAAGAAGITAAAPAGTSLAPGFFGAESLGTLASGASILGNASSGASGGAVANGSIIPGIPNNLLGAGLGALLGGVGGSEAGTTTTVQDIPAWLKPFALQGMQGLSEAYGQTPDGMSPITAAGGQYMQDVIGGDYLNNNPYLDAMFDRAAGKLTAGVNSQFSGAGRYGSGAHQGVLGETLGNLATDIYSQNYGRERGFQQQAAQGSPDFGTASILQPFAKSQAILEGVGGIRGGTTTSPYFRNRPAEILAGALGGASLFS